MLETVEELQQQINDILAQVAQLQRRRWHFRWSHQPFDRFLHAFENPLRFASEFNPIGLSWIYEGVPDSYEDAAGGLGTVFSVGGAAKVAGSGEAAGPLDDEYTGALLMGESLRIRFGGQRHPILINERNKY